MANKSDRSSRGSPLTASAFAGLLLEVVRPLRERDVLRNGVDAQLSMPHVVRFEVHLRDARGWRRAEGGSRADGGSELPEMRLPGQVLGVALAEPAPVLLAGGDERLPDALRGALTHLSLTRLREGEDTLGVMAGFWRTGSGSAAIERLASRDGIFANHLALGLTRARTFEELEQRRVHETRVEPPDANRILRDEQIRELERRNLLAALAASGGKVSGPGGAAERLGVPSSTLASRIRALGLRRGAWSLPTLARRGV